MHEGSVVTIMGKCLLQGDVETMRVERLCISIHLINLQIIDN